MPSNSSHFFPRNDEDRLANETGYFVWAHRMRKAYSYCGLLDIVNGSLAEPTDSTTHKIWSKMDAAASALLTGCIKAELVVKIAHLATTNAAWDLLAAEFNQIGSGSIIYWFRRLTKHMTSGSDVSAHINEFQEAIRYLANADLIVPEWFSAAVLLSTLPCDPKDPDSWDYFVKGVRIDKKTTTLSSIVSELLEEKRRQTPATTTATSETALAALERTARAIGAKFCTNCKREGHTKDECWAKGGGKEGKGPKRKGKPKKKGKGNENAKVATEEGGDETSNVVLEKCLVATETATAVHLPTEPLSPTPSPVENSVYSARTASSPTPIIDSGASTHIIADRTSFKSYSPSSGNISGFGNSQSVIAGRGEAQLLASRPTGGTISLKLRDTCHVPSSTLPIVSVSRLDDADCYTLFGAGRSVTFELKDDGQMIHNILNKSRRIVFTATRRTDRLYYMDTPRCRSDVAYHAVTPTSKLELLHRRLGHLNYQSVRALVKKGLVTGIKITQSELEYEPPVCPSCAMGKITRASFPLSESSKANRFLALIHSDLWGPAPVQTASGTRYMMTLTDDYTRWVWILFLRNKSDAFTAFKEWRTEVENTSGMTIQKFRTDNGGEYFNTAWINYMKQHGIRWESTTPRTPEQNGVSERLNRSVIDRVRTILIDTGLPLFLWAEAANYVVYTKNRHSTRSLKNTTPYEKRYGRKPNVSRLHRFGCTAYVLDDSPKRRKLDPKGKCAVFLGYSETQKGWRLYHPDKRRVQVSTHVTFDDANDLRDSFQAEGEYQFSYKSLKSSSLDDDDTSPEATRPEPEPQPQQPQQPPIAQPNQQEQPLPLPQPRARPEPPPPRAPSSRTAAAKARAAIAETARMERSDDEKSSEDEAEVNDTLTIDSPDEEINIASGEDPRTYREAMNSPDCAEWEQAMRDELDSIAQLGTYSLVELPPGREAIDTKWVYRIKRDEAGRITRYKARLVARGFTQKPGVDFDETFAPVARIESIRLLCAIAAALDWEIHVIDVDSAFLNSEMPDEQPAYVKQPAGFEAKGREHLVWLLLKALYGLKQSGYLWYKKLKSILIEIGFVVCLADPCVFVRRRKTGICIIASHVDDLGLYVSSLNELKRLKDEFGAHVSFKDQGEIRHILGIEVIRDRAAHTISLSHRRYIDSMIKTYGLESANPVTTPEQTGLRLSRRHCPTTDEETREMRNVPYQNAVGALNHCAVMTRPDIAHAVQQVAQFAADPGRLHWTAVKRVLRYLKGTRELALTLGGQFDGDTITPHAFSDADFANSPDNGRSVSGYAVMLGAGIFSWSAKKQTATALSTGEAEYYAATHVGREILWLRHLLAELGFTQTNPTTLHIDNTAAIRILTTPDETSTRTRHIRLSYFWIKDEIVRKQITPQHVTSAENTADIFTKGLPTATHGHLVRSLGLLLRTDAS